MAGTRFFCLFDEDPGFWHERVRLWPVRPGVGPRGWAITTPDGDIKVEKPGDYHEQHDIDPTGTGFMLPPGVQCYRFRAAPNRAQMRALKTQGRGAALEAREAQGLRVPSCDESQIFVDWAGAEHSLVTEGHVRLLDDTAGSG